MRCETCFHHCELGPGQSGLCRVRCNEAGQIVDAGYGLVTSMALDPIEKKPLRDFYPGSLILSVGGYGCNLRCPFCQNHEISQQDLRQRSVYVSTRDLVKKALELRPAGNIGIAFTYNEPMVGWEYVLDAARAAKEEGLKTVVVTNGTVKPWVLEKVLPYIDAFNVDLKAYKADVYREYGGDLESVKRFIQMAAAHSHVEVTSLIVPGKNDDAKDMEAQAKWLADIDENIPLHITRYFPRWKQQDPPTDIETLKNLKKAAQKYLRRVYIGNI